MIFLIEIFLCKRKVSGGSWGRHRTNQSFNLQTLSLCVDTYTRAANKTLVCSTIFFKGMHLYCNIFLNHNFQAISLRFVSHSNSITYVNTV